ncbi:MAG: hypothetical protein DME40_09730 [Verrucomicrobia bacterium]|nr:MAG: hypothetical protein DME40_09730 [Verrucomicrobiota bacterium]
MARARRAQPEAAAAAHAEVILLARCRDYCPIFVSQRLGVHRPRLGATERPVIADHRFRAHDHQLLAIDLGQLGSLLQDRFEDCLRHLYFHGWSFSYRCGTAITACVTIGVFSLPALVRPCYNSVKSHDGRTAKAASPRLDRKSLLEKYTARLF